MNYICISLSAILILSVQVELATAEIPLVSNFVVSSKGFSVSQLGNGYDLMSELPMPNTCLVNLANVQPEINPRPGGEHVSYSLVENSEQVAKSMSASISAGYGGGLFSASGSLSFSTGYNFSSDDTLVFVTKLVPTKTYWVTQVSHQAGEVDISPSIITRLKQIAKSSGVPAALADFRRRCGDGYIDRLAFGGYLAGHMDVHNSSQVQRSSLESSLSGSGWGYSANASYSTQAMNATAGHSVDVAIDAYGSNNIPSPRDIDQFNNYFQVFGTAPGFVDDALFSTVRSYIGLASWPSDPAFDLRTAPSMLDELTLLAARLADLNATYSKIAENRGAYHNLFYSDWSSFDAAHDKIVDDIQLVSDLMQKCTGYSDKCAGVGSFLDAVGKVSEARVAGNGGARSPQTAAWLFASGLVDAAPAHAAAVPAPSLGLADLERQYYLWLLAVPLERNDGDLSKDEAENLFSRAGVLPQLPQLSGQTLSGDALSAAKDQIVAQRLDMIYEPLRSVYCQFAGADSRGDQGLCITRAVLEDGLQPYVYGTGALPSVPAPTPPPAPAPRPNPPPIPTHPWSCGRTLSQC